MPNYKRFQLGDSFDSREAYLELEEIRDEQGACEDEICMHEEELERDDLTDLERETIEKSIQTERDALEDLNERAFPLEMMEQALDGYGFMTGVMLVSEDDFADHVREKTLDLIRVHHDTDSVLVDLLGYVNWDSYAEDAATNYTIIDADSYYYYALI